MRPGIAMAASNNKIRLGHGSGGRLSRELVDKVFLKYFADKELARLDDAAALKTAFSRLAFTTDSYVVSPLFFPGADIGRLAVCGTVNDLSVKGAIPKWLSAAFILEEGLPFETLERVCASMRAAAIEAGVAIVTGDTKVVEKGKADGLFISTAGVGEIPPGVDLSSAYARKGDAVIVSGALGAHGLAVLNARHGLGLKGAIKSDAAPLNKLAAAVLKACPRAHVMRDLTRGGLAGALVEIAESSGVKIEIEAEAVPVERQVRAAAAILGLDPLYSANEGRLVCFAPAQDSEKIVRAMRADPNGKGSAVIGFVVGACAGGAVLLRTEVGGVRKLALAEGEQLPRIC
ncbi:MAG TPA: hydrogenase expression/formation protein HypE [Elusimicrobiales bacterium]|nr:hydrogenase expression/formation protein HypE [Elusimicrobiales bacterium]